MQQDNLRDFLKFFRFHLPWFVLSAGFFAVILLSGIFFSSRITNFQNAKNQSAQQEIALSVPEQELPADLPKISESDTPTAPEGTVVPSPVVKTTPTPAPTIAPTPYVTPIAAPRPLETPQPVVTPKPITENESQIAGTYEVKSGDTLWAISVKNYGSGYDYSRISRANNLINPNQIVIGQKLSLPAKTEAGKIASGVSIDLGDGDKTVTAGTYRIVKGDSLWKIAEQQLGDPFRWTELYQLNKASIGSNPDLIYPNVVLKMPAKVTGTTSSSSSVTLSPNWTSSLLQ